MPMQCNLGMLTKYATWACNAQCILGIQPMQASMQGMRQCKPTSVQDAMWMFKHATTHGANMLNNLNM